MSDIILDEQIKSWRNQDIIIINAGCDFGKSYFNKITDIEIAEYLLAHDSHNLIKQYPRQFDPTRIIFTTQSRTYIYII